MSERPYYSDDYAGFDSKNLSVYYGYEETDINDEWCFIAKAAHKEIIRIPVSKLGVKDQFNTQSCLLAGLAVLLDRYSLVKK